MEGVNLAKIYCKHFCKCHNVPQYHNNMVIKNKIKTKFDLVPVAHTYNPSYSGGRIEAVYSSKAVQANSSQDPILKMPNTKQGWQSGSSGRVPA
jgi:hypothetical protein